MSISVLRRKYSKLKKSNANAKLLMLELFANSGGDYTTERMAWHMRKCGVGKDEGDIYKWMLDFESSGNLVFVGHIPIYTENNHVYIGTDPVFGFINQQRNGEMKMKRIDLMSAIDELKESGNTEQSIVELKALAHEFINHYEDEFGSIRSCLIGLDGYCPLANDARIIADRCADDLY